MQLILYIEKRGKNIDFEEDEEILERTIEEALEADKLSCSTPSVLPGVFIDLMMHGKFRQRTSQKFHPLKNEPAAGIRLLVFLIYVVFCPWDQMFYEKTLAPIVVDWAESDDRYAPFQMLYGMFTIGGCGKPGVSRLSFFLTFPNVISQQSFLF